MTASRIVVLKFGGSVLRDEGTLRRAVHEIHRWRRDDHRVVAVVSALAGATDDLFQSCRALDAEAEDIRDDNGHAVAAVVAGGEHHSAALLGLLLSRAGLPARVLSPAAIGLVAQGPALDAEPSRLDTGPITAALADDDVVVVPGFVALDDAGRTVVLGRGGSDLTALFLASRLHASVCRLIKDVDGLFEWDPARPGPTPPRYSSASWEHALSTDGSILQHKAVRFARAHRLAFELGNANSVQPTLIGGDTSLRLAHSASERPLAVALLGLGTVGGGLYELLSDLPDRFAVTTVLVRDTQRPRDVRVDPAILTTDPDEALAGADVVVEALGGTTAARAWIEQALSNGADVVTANKAVVAEHGAALEAAARRSGGRLLCSATVGGSTPVLERLVAAPAEVRRVRGVLNGTVNFVLEELSRGRSLDAALGDARRLGLAERDATRDLDGTDAADKLVVIAGRLGVALDELQLGEVPREALDERAALRAANAGPTGRLHQVSTLTLREGEAQARVTLEELEVDDPLAAARGAQNVVVIERVDGTEEVVRGTGAGRWPTAESLLGDLLQLARQRDSSAGKLELVSSAERGAAHVDG